MCRVEKTQGSHSGCSFDELRDAYTFLPFWLTQTFLFQVALPASGVSKRRPVVASRSDHSHCPASLWEPGGHLSPSGCIERDGGAVGRARWGRQYSSSSPGLQAPLVSAKSIRPIAPSLSFQVQLRCSVTAKEPRSWQPPPPRRQQHLSAPGTRLACGTYLAERAPGLSCIDFLLAVHPKRETQREQLPNSRVQAPGEHK